MAELWDHEVKSVDGAVASVRCLAIQDDRVFSSKNFALQLVCELYRHLRRRGLAEKHPHREQLEEWLELMDGKEVEISRAEHDRLRGDRDLRRAEGLTGVGFAEGRYRKVFGTEYEQFRNQAATAISEVHLTGEVMVAKEWGSCPEATVVFTVANPGWLLHMKPGVQWSSAIYDFEDW